MSTIQQAKLVADFVKKRLHLEDEVAGPMLACIIVFVFVVFVSAVAGPPDH